MTVVDTAPALIGMQSCGCVTYANARPDELDRDDQKAIAQILANGGQMLRMTSDEARALPHFLVSKCPHDPKGWEPTPKPKTEPHLKSFRRVRSREVSRPRFAGIKGWDRFDFGEVRKWDGQWWATDGWFNYREPGAHNGMLTYDEDRENADRETLHLGPFTNQRDAAEALLPYAVEYAAGLQAKWAKQREATASTENLRPDEGTDVV